ncbi:YeiH family protein [[Pseudomonas] boreopolis]|uniref:YeiH family protein n=1 Tax=Xanthomonas boreopolis TaxID=86183 RepID=UPI003D9BA9FC
MNTLSVQPARSPERLPSRPSPLPGLLLTAAIALSSLQLARLDWLQAHGLSALTVAIVLGMLLGNTLYPAWGSTAGSGVAVSKGTLLRAGIVLYGLRLTFQDVAKVGGTGVLVDAMVLASTFALAWLLGTRLLGLDRGTALLVGAGSSICGAAAVMAAEPVVRGRAEQVTVAVATVVVFGTLAMFAYPLLYRVGVDHGWLAMTPEQYGLYAGSTVHEVAQVYAAGRAIGSDAADAAVIAKMVRVMMLAPFLVLLSWMLARLDRRAPAVGARRAGSPIVVPWFAFGFVGVVGLGSLHWLPAPLVQAANALDTVLLAMAMAALGLTTHVSALRQAGPRPLFLAGLLFAWLLLGGLAINLGVRGLFG